MTNAKNIKAEISKNSLNLKPETQEAGGYLSPAYLPVAIPVDDIINQAMNPNAQVDQSFKALQTSIFNSGYTFPIIVSENELYNEEIDPADKPQLVNEDGTRTVEYRDPAVRQFFKYSIVDGSHRLQVVREGKYWFDKATSGATDQKWYAAITPDKWAEGKNIPSEPGKVMLAYLAWREDFQVPCTVLRGKSSTDLMSSEILHNSARGTHTLDSMKDIVSSLLDAGMSEDWISRNLYMDKEAIGRYKQLSGLASAFKDAGEFSTDVWDPIKDRSDERKKNIKTTQAARAYVRKWRSLANAEGGKFEIPYELDILAAAINLGFDANNPLVQPKLVDTETGEVLETALADINEVGKEEVI